MLRPVVKQHACVWDCADEMSTSWFAYITWALQWVSLDREALPWKWNSLNVSQWKVSCLETTVRTQCFYVLMGIISYVCASETKQGQQVELLWCHASHLVSNLQIWAPSVQVSPFYRLLIHSESRLRAFTDIRSEINRIQSNLMCTAPQIKKASEDFYKLCRCGTFCP